MSPLTIINADPLKYKEQIVHLWNQCLPGTPPERLDWMANGNPAGQSEWFLAINETYGSIVGTASLMPKDFYYNGSHVKGGIVGDLMTVPAFRKQGISRQLLKSLLDSVNKQDMKLLYSVPNRNSKKILIRAGLNNNVNLRNYLIPVDVEFYLNKLVSINCKGNFFSSIVDRLFHCNNYDASKVSISVPSDGFGPEFDELWQSMKTIPGILVGSKSSDYLNWRYGKHPATNFRVLKYQDNAGRLIGYCVFSIEGNRFDLWDIICLEEYQYACLISALRSFARERGCSGIYFYVNRTNPIVKILRLRGLFRIGGDMDLLYTGDILNCCSMWMFFPAERNI